jgi:hypothetical protein
LCRATVASLAYALGAVIVLLLREACTGRFYLFNASDGLGADSGTIAPALVMLLKRRFHGRLATENAILEGLLNFSSPGRNCDIGPIQGQDTSE